MDASCFALILAAGKGTRMRSDKPKVLHTLLGEPMLALVLAAVRPLFGDNVLIVAGHGSNLLHKAFAHENFVEQAEQLGTGHALKTALPVLKRMGAKRVAVINGDVPLVTIADVQAFAEAAVNADIAFATINLPDPGVYGRVVRSSGGEILAIVEAKDYDIQKLGSPSGEVNAGMYSLDIARIEPLLSGLSNDNKSGEYYLTDIAALGIKHGLSVKGIPCGKNANLLGVNSPVELAAAEDMLAARVARNLLENGVTVHAPELLRASPLAVIEPGAEISGPAEIFGSSHIHSGAVVDSFCVIKNSVVHKGAHVRHFSHLENAEVGERALVGPYTRLRPGAMLCADAHAGNFVELKQACLGEGAKANHLSYLGDADIGPGANIGAGTITCNYDGVCKHHTSIGAHAFIGSNTALVAPVSVGSNVLVGAGSVITKNVSDGELAIARGKQKNMPKRKL